MRKTIAYEWNFIFQTLQSTLQTLQRTLQTLQFALQTLQLKKRRPLNNGYFCGNLFFVSIIFCTFADAFARAVVMFSEEDGAEGWGTTN